MAQNHISGASIDSHYHASVHRADYHVTLTLGAGNRRRCAGIKGVTVGVTEKGGGVNLKLLLYFGTLVYRNVLLDVFVRSFAELT